MGSPILGAAAYIVMENLENETLNDINYPIPFYFWYIDDTLICMPKNKINCILKTFNLIDKKLNCTLELSNDNKINFLDITLILENNRIITDWYRKPVWSGRFLNFASYHPIYNKIEVISGLVDYRDIKLSDKRFHNENLDIIGKTLLRKVYPINFLKAKIAECHGFSLIQDFDDILFRIKKKVILKFFS